MLNPTLDSTIDIVISKEDLEEDFPEYDFPFNLKKEIKELEKCEGIKYIADEIAALYRKDPELRLCTCLTSKAIKTCGIYKIRIAKLNNRGKSSGYRVIFLLITSFGKGYVIDIADHSVRDDLTDKQKIFCNKLVKDLDEAIRETNN